MRSLTDRRRRGRRPRRPAEVSGGGRCAGGMNFFPYGLSVSGSLPGGGGGVKTPPYGAKDKRVAMARLRAGHARPLRTATNGLCTRGAREGGSPPPLQWAGVARKWMATQGPSESPSHLTVTAPFDKGASLSPLRGFGGTPDSKVEEGAGALRTKSNTAFV